MLVLVRCIVAGIYFQLNVTVCRLHLTRLLPQASIMLCSEPGLLNCWTNCNVQCYLTVMNKESDLSLQPADETQQVAPVKSCSNLSSIGNKQDAMPFW